MSRGEPPDDGIDGAFVSDDAVSRAQRAVGLLPARGGFGLGRRIALAIGLGWVPLAAWALWNGRALPGGAEPEPLLAHFGIHVRFLVAVPLFFVAEATTDAAVRRIVPQFVTSGLVDASRRPAFDAILRDAAKLRRSWLGIAVVGAAVVALLALGAPAAERSHELVWARPEGARATFPVLWFDFVSRPIFLFVLVTWIWRFFVLARSFARIARLDLLLVPTHPDRAGGLGFLESLPAGLAPLFFAIAAVVASRWAHDALYHGHDVNALRIPAAVLVGACVAIGLFPLFAFAPRLAALRRRSLLEYGALLTGYGRAFERRWIRREADGPDAPLLAAPEIGPVADTVALYEAVSRTRPVPLSRRSVVPIVLAAALPLLPVVATQIPLREVLVKVIAPLL
jgi:hypothetical protein